VTVALRGTHLSSDHLLESTFVGFRRFYSIIHLLGQPLSAGRDALGLRGEMAILCWALYIF
jgi:hypothetical protein